MPAISIVLPCRNAATTIGEAVECDPDNPDAQIFFEQRGQLIEQIEAEEAAGGGGMPGAGSGGPP